MSCSLQTAPALSAIPSALILTLLIAAAVFGALAPLGKAQSVAAPQFSSSSAVSPSASSTQHPLDLTPPADQRKPSSDTTSPTPSVPIPSQEWPSWAPSISPIRRPRLPKSFRQACFDAWGHAVISTVTSRRGDDGHRGWSFPAIVAPYAGTMSAVYGWYPSRYGVKDGLRMGNDALLALVGGNIAREFIHGGPHTLFGHASHSTPLEPAAKSKPSEPPRRAATLELHPRMNQEPPRVMKSARFTLSTLKLDQRLAAVVRRRAA
jgi:hypothetical protein